MVKGKFFASHVAHGVALVSEFMAVSHNQAPARAAGPWGQCVMSYGLPVHLPAPKQLGIEPAISSQNPTALATVPPSHT